MTTRAQHRRYLQYPLYKLFYVRDLTPNTNVAEEGEALARICGGRALRGVVAALDWLADRPDENLTTVLPGLPHSNEDMHFYLRRLRAQLASNGRRRSRWWGGSGWFG